MSGMPPAPGSSDVVVLKNEELGVPGFPRLPLLPTDWGKVAEGTELACSQVTSARRLLREALAMMGQDIIQLARVCLRKFLYPTFPGSSFFG
jgi:hypothetical protein